MPLAQDANVVATASFDGWIKLWDVSTGTFIREMNAGHGCVYAISWDAQPSSTMLAAGAIDGRIDIWDTSKGALLRSLRHHNQVRQIVLDGTRRPASVMLTMNVSRASAFRGT